MPTYPNSEVEYPHGSKLIPIGEIQIKERGRKDLGDIESLAASIRDIGLITPILVDQDGSLVAGERRLRAHQLLELPQIATVSRIVNTESQATELELEENQARKSMRWHEECLLIAKTHKLKCKESKEETLSLRDLSILEATGSRRWGQRQTGALMGHSLGQVSMAIKVADYILRGDEEILAATNISDAAKILLKRREDEITAKRAAAVVSVPEPTSKPSSGTLGGGVFDILKEPDTSDILDDAPANQSAQQVPLSTMFYHDDAIDFLNAQPESFYDHIITDPPYGIDMENLNLAGVDADIKSTHQVEQNLDLLETFITLAFKVTKDKGHMFMWADPVHFEKILTWGEAAGWRMQRWPLIWHKLSPCKNNAANQNTTKDYEICVHFRKGNATLTTPGGSSIFTSDNPDAKMYNNPFAKPFEVWKWLIEKCALKGQKILDPFGGEFSFARAAINCGMVPISVEISKQHYDKGIVDISDFYRTLLRGNVEFI